MEVTYCLKSGNKIVSEVQDSKGDSLQFFSGQRLVLVRQIPVKDLTPGDYELEIQVLDRIGNKTLVARTPFKVNPGDP